MYYTNQTVREIGTENLLLYASCCEGFIDERGNEVDIPPKQTTYILDEFGCIAPGSIISMSSIEIEELYKKGLLRPDITMKQLLSVTEVTRRANIKKLALEFRDTMRNNQYKSPGKFRRPDVHMRIEYRIIFWEEFVNTCDAWYGKMIVDANSNKYNDVDLASSIYQQLYLFKLGDKIFKLEDSIFVKEVYISNDLFRLAHDMKVRK